MSETLTEAEREALLRRAEEACRLCGPCDSGLPMGCNCDPEPRAVIAGLLDIVADLRARLAAAEVARADAEGGYRVAAEAVDRFRDVLADCLDHTDENPGDDVLVAEVREHFGKAGPEPHRWRDFVTAARAQVDQINADRPALAPGSAGDTTGGEA